LASAIRNRAVPCARVYRDDLEAAHPPELAPKRVSERVLKGGHDVDPATAVRRYHRSHEQLRWFAPRADFLMIFDNSDNRPEAVPILLARRFPDRPLTHVQRGVNPVIDQVLTGLNPNEKLF
jgi:hypothetical protein